MNRQGITWEGCSIRRRGYPRQGGDGSSQEVELTWSRHLATVVVYIHTPTPRPKSQPASAQALSDTLFILFFPENSEIKAEPCLHPGQFCQNKPWRFCPASLPASFTRGTMATGGIPMLHWWVRCVNWCGNDNKKRYRPGDRKSAVLVYVETWSSVWFCGCAAGFLRMWLVGWDWCPWGSLVSIIPEIRNFTTSLLHLYA